MIKIIFPLFFISITTLIQAQILDDSTKVVYGPHLTKYLNEDNIKYDRLEFAIIDTSLLNEHRWSKVEKAAYYIQDLGVSGTAIRSIFYNPPSIIGARPGYSAYLPYYKSINDFKYYDTKSPYSKIDAAIGGQNRTFVDVGFNRSDSSNFNIGIDYFNTNSDKQIASRGKGDRLTKNEGFDGYLMFFTKSRKYLIIGNFSRLKTNAVDQGGIDIDNSEFGFFNTNSKVYLTNAHSEYLKRTYHIYHQFKLNKTTQLYQVMDRTYDKTKFIFNPQGSELDYFNTTYFNTKSTNDSTIFKTISLENGLKGIVGPLFFSIHYKYRIYTFDYSLGDLDTLGFKNNKPSQDGIEHYIGGRVRYNLSPNYKLSGGIDFNLNGNKKLWGKLQLNKLNINLLTQQYQPTYMEKAYLGNHNYWINDFKAIKTLKIDANYTYTINKTSFIEPSATFTTFTDYVYYNKQAAPAQLNTKAGIITFGAKFLINPINKFYVEFEGLFNSVLSDSAQVFPLPKIMTNLNIYLHDISFAGNLDWQVGIDNHWKSDYFAPNYNVATNQFFIQNNFNVKAFLISDFYINIKVGNVIVFFKYNNIKDAFTKETYFTAPNYIGKRSTIDYGFYWMFFD